VDAAVVDLDRQVTALVEAAPHTHIQHSTGQLNNKNRSAQQQEQVTLTIRTGQGTNARMCTGQCTHAANLSIAASKAHQVNRCGIQRGLWGGNAPAELCVGGFGARDEGAKVQDLLLLHDKKSYMGYKGFKNKGGVRTGGTLCWGGWGA
jgi:hypothetical protein